MAGQNDIFQPNTNTGGAVVSRASSDGEVTQISGPRKNKNKSAKPIFFAIIGAIGATGICALVYFLFLDPNRPIGSTVAVYDATSISDGSETDEETNKKLDERIGNAENDEEKLDATLSKVRYLFLDEEYDEALSILNGISTSGLNDYDLYRLYNHFYTAYTGKGDAANAERYKRMSDEARSRDVANQ
jgi:hypothetical protein